MNKFLGNLVFSKRTAATLAIGSLLTISTSEIAKAKLEDSPKAIVDEVWQIVNSEYVDQQFNHVDWFHIRQELLEKNYTSKKEAYETIRELLKQLRDPYTRFLDPQEFEALTNQTSGELSGIGIRLQLDQESNELIVIEPLENSPADKAGVQAGDKIIKINGKPTALMTVEQASEEIRGKVGTEVELEIQREEQEPFQISVARAQIEVPSVSYSLKEEGNTRIGYIKLDEFSSHAAEQMKEAIEKLQAQNVSGFVLDLRDNPGGLLYASVDIARMWMEKGLIVRTIDRQTTCQAKDIECGKREFSANGTAITDLPLVILVNEYSASASEILAGALKENGRATLVGTRTYGKGTVQAVHTLADGSGLAVTIARYYPPSGTNINKKGISPNVAVQLSTQEELLLQNDPSMLGTEADPQYTKAIALLKSTPSNYQHTTQNSKLIVP